MVPTLKWSLQQYNNTIQLTFFWNGLKCVLIHRLLFCYSWDLTPFFTVDHLFYNKGEVNNVCFFTFVNSLDMQQSAFHPKCCLQYEVKYIRMLLPWKWYSLRASSCWHQIHLCVSQISRAPAYRLVLTQFVMPASFALFKAAIRHWLHWWGPGVSHTDTVLDLRTRWHTVATGLFDDRERYIFTPWRTLNMRVP